MKKILNFSLCMILVLSLCAGNITFGLDSAGSYVYAKAEGQKDQENGESDNNQQGESEESKKSEEPTKKPETTATVAPKKTEKPKATTKPAEKSEKKVKTASTWSGAPAFFYVWNKGEKFWKLKYVGVGKVDWTSFVVINNDEKTLKHIKKQPNSERKIKWRSILIGNIVIGVYADETEEPPMEKEDMDPNKVEMTIAPTPTATPEVTPTATPEVTPTATPEVAPTVTPEVTPTAKPTLAPTATPTVEQSTAQFFIRISNEEPKEPYSYPSTDYHPVGTGTIIAEEVCNNPEAVKAHVISFQLEGQYAERYKMDVDNIKWYVIKRESDGWHVDGVIKKEQIVVVPTEKPTAVPTVTPTAVVTVAPTVTPTAVVTVAPTTTAAVVPTEKPEEIETPDPVTMVAKFFLLIENLEQPEEPFRHPTKNYVYVGTGTAIQEEVANDDEKVKRNILEAPDVSMYETDGWIVRWYVIKHESDGWHVDGIREKSPSTVTPPAVTATPVVTATAPAVTATAPAVTATAPAVTATAPAVTATAPAVTATASVPGKETNRPTVTYLPFGPQKPSVNPTTKPEASALPTTKPGSSVLPTTKPGSSVLPTTNPESGVLPTTKAEPTVSPTSNPDTGKDLPNKTENPAVDADSEKDEINNGTPGETSAPGEGTKVEESAKPEEGIIPTENPGSEEDNKGTDNVDPTQSAAPTSTTDPTTGSDDTIKVPDGTIPATHPDSDYEDIEEPTNPITTPDLVDVKPDDIASSGVSKDTDDEDDTSKKTKQEQKDDDDTVTVPEKDIPNSDVSASPKTGDNSGNVLFIFGRMICALGVFIFVLKRRKVTK